MKKSQIGVYGLGVMGQSIAINLLNHEYQVSVYNKSSEKTKYFIENKIEKNHKVLSFQDIESFVESLEKPRKILLMITAGKNVDNVIESLLPYLSPQDILIDGGNSYFKDTIRRNQFLKEKEIYYIGMGISGGEQGAMHGPSMMPSGNYFAYSQVQEMFENIAAKAHDHQPCITYIGEDGSGHYVKMVHNGIEYADIQIISEAYDLMRYVADMSVEEIQQVFEKWNQGKLQSYLIEITADILKKKDEETGKYLIDVILDKAAQKGTGKWTSLEGLEIGSAIPTIVQSVFARFISSKKEERMLIAKEFEIENNFKVLDKKAFVVALEKAVYASKIASYAQGFDLLKKASQAYQWELDYGKIAMIWREGCIIKAQFLEEIQKAYQKEVINLMVSETFKKDVQEALPSWKEIAKIIIDSGRYAPGILSALSYFEGISSSQTGANLIQAQRDYFGAHTYERIDKAGDFHTIW